MLTKINFFWDVTLRLLVYSSPTFLNIVVPSLEGTSSPRYIAVVVKYHAL